MLRRIIYTKGAPIKQVLEAGGEGSIRCLVRSAVRTRRVKCTSPEDKRSRSITVPKAMQSAETDAITFGTDDDRPESVSKFLSKSCAKRRNMGFLAFTNYSYFRHGLSLNPRYDNNRIRNDSTSFLPTPLQNTTHTAKKPLVPPNQGLFCVLFYADGDHGATSTPV